MICERCKAAMFLLSSLTYQHLVLCSVGWATWRTSMTLPGRSVTCPSVVNVVPWIFSVGSWHGQSHIITMAESTTLPWDLGCRISSSVWGKFPLVSVSGQWHSPTVEMWVPCPMITCYGKKASKPFCLLGIWKREKSYGCLLTPEGSKSLMNVDVSITLGFWE